MTNVNNLLAPRTLSALVQRIKGGSSVTDTEIKRFDSNTLYNWKDKEKPHYTLMEYALITANLSNVKLLGANNIGVVSRNPYDILMEQSPFRDSDLKDTVGILNILAKNTDIPIPDEFVIPEARKKSLVGATALKCVAEIRELRAKEHENKQDKKI